MKIWVDDIIPAPEGYIWCRSVNQAKKAIEWFLMVEWTIKGHNEPFEDKIELIDIDHDAGNFVSDGGHYIKLLEWLEETGRNYPIHIHSDNQINLLWMREIIERNGWKEI